MLMVTEVVEIDDESVVTTFKIEEDCVFLKCDGNISETGLIENAAQTCSAVVGQSYFEKDDLEGKGNTLVGYISAIKKVEIFSLPKVSETLVTKANLISRYDTGGVTICSLEAETCVEKKMIVKATLNFLIHEV